MRPLKHPIVIVLFLALTILSDYAQGQTHSSIVYPDSNDCLVYHSDTESNRVPDFSRVGYRLSSQALPMVPVVKTINPIPGDNTQHIQEAINEVAQRSVDSLGHRGAILLSAGTYEIHGVIQIPSNGIVLRGEKAQNNDSLKHWSLALEICLNNVICL